LGSLLRIVVVVKSLFMFIPVTTPGRIIVVICGGWLPPNQAVGRFAGIICSPRAVGIFVVFSRSAKMVVVTDELVPP